ncbi:filamentous hemagglutinin N-terminal domain-containing protein [Calothrix sp. FACHB-1219]|uniref:two-partner secretion domain-containing protein n=1 Tax=unclassified Calothrix TaxID=2619626 RepID=UPI001689CE77|nr:MULTISPECIES: filamentous hemagglutinin N-terminal domain-containing protein [unclassified Calothrix]MBD2207423.1 filamentous hemagglutinin N-terminal domain-containing protein [Calothrix sp. FACHB-168]MBD2221999.1 filamentous hemagglutinin N-terminal domain-containing protein [Calothrix sp. FACHB-1219]
MNKINNLLQILFGCFFLIFFNKTVKAQIIPDNTLGVEASRLTPNVLINGVNADKIDGGAQRGINLFHSFSEFNINNGQRIYFANPSGIENILTRVTGNSAANIFGILGVDGNANLFLINPNGILFGENARLDVRGSFVATTANAVQFGEQGFFQATNPEPPPLLTIQPSALFFSRINTNSQGITNRIRPNANDAALNSSFAPQQGSRYWVGGNITFDDGQWGVVNNRAELGGLAEVGSVGLVGNGNQMQLAFPEGVLRADVLFQKNALVLTTGGGEITVNAGNISLSDNSVIGTSGGGAITVNGSNISLSGRSFITSILQSGEGTPGVATGDVVVNATGDITLDNLSSIGNQGAENSLGDTGNIVINAQSIRLTNQSQVASIGTRSRGNIILNAKENVSLDGYSYIGTFGTVNPIGKSGDITIVARNINFNNESGISSFNNGQGQGGKITLKAQEGISLTTKSTIVSSSNASGFGQVNNQPSGDIEIKTRTLTLDGRDTSITSANLDEGDGGNIQIVADDSILLNGLNGIASISSSSTGKGDSGNIQLNTRSLTLANGGNVGTQSSGSGRSGNLFVNASDSVTLSGTTTFIYPQTGQTQTTGSRFATSSFGTGKSGELTINTQRLSINDGGEITTNTQFGLGGDLTINATELLEVVGSSPNALSTISTSTFGSKDAGSLNISAGRLSIREGGIITTLTSGTGKAGSLTIDVKASVEVVGGSLSSPNSRSNISTATFGSGDAGSIKINAGSFSIRDGARVSTSTFAQGKGGSLTVNADGSVEIIGTSADGRFFTGLDATAESDSTGDAGDLTITSQDLLVRDGGQVNTGTFGGGKGGNLTVNTSNKVLLIGTSADGRFVSGLGSSTNQNSTGDAGDLTIKTQDLLVRDGAIVNTGTYGTGKGGNLTVNASGTVEIIGTSADGFFNSSSLSTSANQGLTGNAGDLTINAQNLLVRDGGQVNTGTFGAGKGGNLTINTSNKVQLIGTSADGRSLSALGASAGSGSTGDAGDLTINTQDLLVRDGAQISASTSGRGKGGNLTVNASKKVELIGTSADGSILSGLGASVQEGSTGDAGSLTIKTQDLLVRDGAAVSTATFGTGKGGNLIINAANSVQLTGTSADGSISGVSTSAYAGSIGDAGNLQVDTQNIIVRDGAQISASTFSSGRGGNLTVNASRQIELIGRSADGRFPSGLFASAERDSTGDAGDLKVDTQNLFISDRAGVFVNSQGTGNAGIMTINASRIRLDNNAFLNANTSSPNKDPNREQATINLNTGALILSHNSNIVTNATGENVIGGNININADVLAALQNSDISANSSNFRGGRVRITSQRIFGTQTRDFPTPESDITATGANPALSGSTEINQPDLDPSQGTIELPQTIIDPDALIAQNPCLRRGGSEFIVTGKGGLPPSPSQALHTDILEVDLLEPAALTITPTQPPTKTSNDISQQQPVAINANKVVPAQGWVADGDEVILTAYAANGTKIQRQAHSISVCPAK